MLKRVSIYWVLLVALALTSAIPIFVIAFLEIDSARDEFEEQARDRLMAETRNQANAYNNELQEFRLTTDIAASQAQKLLTKRPGTTISDQEVSNRLQKYDFVEYEDSDGYVEDLYGLDTWFSEKYEPRAGDDHVSNAFIDYNADIENDEDLQYTVAVTERLDSLFDALATSLDRSDVIQRHHIFLITTNGMYRVFPFLPVEYTPYEAFDEIYEYVLAGPDENPEREAVWTPPLLDIDPEEGPSIIVANSIPIYGVVLDVDVNPEAPQTTPPNGPPGSNTNTPPGDGPPNGNTTTPPSGPPGSTPPSGAPTNSDTNTPPSDTPQSGAPAAGEEEYLGVMVHDLDLGSLEERINQFAIGDEGQGFIIDSEGYIVIHHNYNPVEVWNNLPQETKDQFFETDELDKWYTENGLDVEAITYYPDLEGHLDEILAEENSEGMFSIQWDDREWVVAYDYIPETDWYFIAMQPHAELIETATEVSTRVQQAGIVMVGIVLIASILLASRITRPVSQLSETARQIEDHVDDETADLITADLRKLGEITSMREIDNLARVFKQMVFALNNRMVELNSVYALGQTITSTIDYDATMQAILSAVREVVKCDAAEIVIKRGNMLVAEAWSGGETFVSSTGHQYNKEDAPIGSLLDKHDVIYLPDVPDEMEFKMETESAEVKSLLAIPLTRNEKLVGALILAHSLSGHFSEDMKRQLVKLSPQASIAIENAVQVKIREDALKQQITELKVAVDKDTRAMQVGEISESDFFKDLQKNAAKLRQRRQGSEDDPKSEGEDDKPKE